MNKHFYRIIFNKARGMLMVVAEIVKNHQGAGRTSQKAKSVCADKKTTSALKAVTFFTYLALGLVSLTATSYANTIVVDKNANKNQQPIVMPTANGATQINIQTPSKGGVSHNKYSQFDVSEKGVILNNAYKDSKTELAGYVKGNDFLIKSGSAKIILNEINAKHASQLNGYIEVAGQKAQVVIANAAGITCNGCGFINANRATLTTGKPLMENGELKGYQVEQGNIAINGKGMDSSRQDYTDLIAQTVTLNSSLWANDATVITGRNTVNVDLTQIKTLAENGQEKPQLAMDVAALGGMYAGKIQLIGTESGVGVHNAGQLGASAGSITITADGKIINSGSIQAKHDIALTSQQDINNSKQIYSKQNIKLNSQKQITNNGTIVAQNNIDLKAKKINSTLNSTVAAGIDDNGKLTQKGNITANAKDITLQGKNIAGQDIAITSVNKSNLANSQTNAKSLTISGQNIDVSSSVLRVENDITLTAVDLIDSSNIQAKTNAKYSAKADTIDNKSSIILAKQAIELTAKDIDNSQSQLASSQNIKLTANNLIDNKQAELQAKGRITLDGYTVENQEVKLLAEDTLVINADVLNNQNAALSAKGDVSIVADSSINNDNAKLITENNLLIQSDTISNTQTNVQAKGDIQITGQYIDGGSSTLISEKSIKIDVMQFANQQAKLSALGHITIIGQILKNQNSQFISGQNINIQSAQLHNQSAVMKSNGQIEVNADQFNNNNAKLITNDKITIKSNDLSNQSAQFNAVNDIMLQSSLIDNQQATLVTTGKLTVIADDVNNKDADLRAKHAITIKANDINNQSALLLSNSTLNLTGDNINNDHTELNAKDTILVTAKSLSANDALVVSDNDIEINTETLVAQDVKIKAKGGVDIQATDDINAANALIITEKQLNIHADNLDLNAATVSAKDDLNVNVSSQLVNDHARWISEGNITVKAQNIDNQYSSISTSKNITMDATGLDNRHSELLSYRNIALTANNLNNQSAKINALGDIIFDANALNNWQAQIVSQQSIKAKADNVDNRDAAMQAHKSLSITANNNIDNTGATLISGEQLQLKSQFIDNQNAKIKSINDIELLADDIDNQQAILLAEGKITLNANNQINNQQADIRANNNIEIEADTLNNQNSLLVTNKQVTINADSLNSQSSTVKAQDSINIVAQQMDSSSSTWVSQQNITISANNLNNQSAVFKTANNIDIQTTGNMHNDLAALMAGDQLHVSAQQLSNQSATLVSNSNMQITASQFDNQQSKVVSGEDLVINAEHIDNTQAELQAKGDVKFDSQTTDNHFAKIISDKTIQINADNKLSNQSAILSAKQKITVQSSLIENNNAKWQSGDSIQVTTQKLDNQSGYLKAQKNIDIDATVFDNQYATLITDESLIIQSELLDNQQATFSAKQDITVNSDDIDNQQALWLANNDINITAKNINNSKAAMQAKQAMMINSDLTLNNYQATLITGLAGLTLNADQLDNTEADLSSKGDIQMTANTADNSQAQMVAEGDLAVNAAAIDNHQANIQSKGNLKLDGQTINNQHAQLLSIHNIQLSATGDINNQQAKLTAQKRIDIQAKGDLDNQQATLTANDGISIDVAELDNSQSTIKTQGLLNITANNINNTQVLLNANKIQLTTHALQNQHAEFIANTFANITAYSITNTNAKLLAGNIDIKSHSLTGDGELLAQNNINIELQGDFVNQKQVLANNQLSIKANQMSNAGQILSGNSLTLESDLSENSQTGEIESNNVLIKGGSFVNNGLVDGDNVELQLSDRFDNNDSARLYGDKITITANELNNKASSLTANAPTIAARNELFIDVDTLNNDNHALLLSMGDMQIDAVSINNHSAQIESLGDMTLTVDTLNNINDAIETEEVLVGTEHITEYSPLGSSRRFSPDEVKIYTSPKKNHRYLVLESVDGAFGSNYKFYKYKYDADTYQTKITSTAPAEIIAGKNLTINAVHIENNSSKIIAGNTLNIEAITLNNLSLQGTQRIESTGSVIYHYRKKKKTKVVKNKYLQKTSTSAYQDEVITSIDLANAKIEDHAVVNNTQLTDNQRNDVDIDVNNTLIDIDNSVTTNNQLSDISGSHLNVSDVNIDPTLGNMPGIANVDINDISTSQTNIDAAKSDGSNTAIDQQNNNNITQGTAVDNTSKAKPAESVSLVEPNTSLPNSSIYIVNKDVEKHYLIETDPKFTNRNKWLSSDYMFKQLKVDQNNLQKRLGDGYYEQQLIREQVVTLTGQRYLGDYSSDIGQYQALMNAGVTFAEHYGLKIGVALSPAQMMALTTDIVWMVSKTVTIDGQDYEVLVPQVYVVNRPQVTAEGALLAGKNVVLKSEGDLNSSGSILAKNSANIVANNVNNQGMIAGSSVTIQAKDSINSSGTLIGDKLVSLSAHKDINLISTTSTTETYYGQNKSINTVIDKVSSIAVKDGNIKLNAGNDINLGAALLVNNGETGQTDIKAGHDINLSTISTNTQQDTIWGNDNYRKMDIDKVVGTEILAKGEVNLLAGNDISIKASSISSDKALSLLADNNIDINSDIEHTQLTDHQKVKWKSTFSKGSETTHIEVDDTTQKGSSLSGDSVTIRASNDLSVTGSQVIATKDVNLIGGNDVTIDAAEESYYTFQQTKTKKSGFSTSGFGVSFGSQSANASFKENETNYSQASSLIGSAGDNVIISAGKTATISGGDIIAGRDINSTANTTGHIDITAQDIIIKPVTDTVNSQNSYSQKSSGIGLSLSNPIIDSVLNLRDIKNSDTSTVQKVKGGIHEVAAMDMDMVSPSTIPLTYDKSSKSGQHNTQGEYQTGSNLSAAGNIQLHATGSGERTSDGKLTNGDILIHGSQLGAGNSIILDANRDVSIIASVDSQKTTSQSQSKEATFTLNNGTLGSTSRFMGGSDTEHGSNMLPYESETSHSSGYKNITAQTSSVLTANDIYINSKEGSVDIAGSNLTAKKDLVVQAKQGDIHVSSGTNTVYDYEKESNSKIGELGSDGYTGTIGYSKENYKKLDDNSTQSTIRSQLNSVEGDITLQASQDVILGGADINASKSINLSGKNVLMDISEDSSLYEYKSNTTKYGVTVSTSGYAVTAAQAIEKAANSIENGDDARLTAIYTAQAALNSTSQATQIAKDGMSSSLIKVTVSATVDNSKQQQQYASGQQSGSALHAGEDVNITATDNIQGKGVDIQGKNVNLNAGQDMIFTAAQSTETLNNKNSGSHYGVGVGFSAVGSQNGFSLEVSGSLSKGKENGSLLVNHNSQIQAENTLNLTSGQDVVLKGAELKGDKVRADIGRDLTISSVQDVESYKSKQTSGGVDVSLCVPPFCMGTSQVSGNFSQDKINSEYASVREQSGLFAGKDGFDITVGEHTQLDGAVIASKAEDKTNNKLDTGTIGFTDIENKASFDVSSMSIAGGVSIEGGKTSPSGGQPSIYNHGDDASSITKSAVAESEIIIRNPDEQQQDINGLSSDTDHAHNLLGKIFDKEKEQKRKEIVTGLQDLAAQVKKLEQDINKDAPKESGDGKMGDSFGKGVDAATSILIGLVTGDIRGGLAGASAPYLAGLIKAKTGENEAANLIAHAILGAAVAELQGNSGLAGGAGAVMGEKAADIIREALYGKKVEDLSEAEKDNVSALAQLATGFAVAGSGGSASDIGAAVASSKNAVENNLLSEKDVEEADKKYAACNSAKDVKACQMKVVEETNDLSRDKDRALQEYKNAMLEELGKRYKEIVADCEGNTKCQLERKDWLLEELNEKYNNFYNQITDGTPSDKLKFKYYPDNTEIESLWNSIKDSPDRLANGIVEGGDKAIRYIDSNTLEKIGDDAWNFGKKIASIPGEWLDKEIPAQSFEAALTELGSMTARDVGEASFDTVAGAATVYLGGKTIQWVGGKWIKVDGVTKPVTKAETGIKWGEGIKGQGMPWEDFVGKELPAGSRLPTNFKTFDYYDLNTGKAVSVKTLDTLTDPKLANPKQIYSSLKSNIDAAASFEKHTLKDVTISSKDIVSKEIRLAIPAATNKAQWEQIYKAIDYGKSQGVKVIVTEVK